MRRVLAIGALVLALAPASARAEALPFEAALGLGHPVTVTVAAAGTDTHVAARAGRRVAEASVPVVLEDATAERIASSAGPVILVRATGGGRAYAWLVVEHAGAPTIAWSGRTDLHGDPGERTADAIETADRTGDGLPDVVVGQVREGVTACGSAPVLLFPSGIDATGTLRPVAIARVGAERTELTATADSPGPTPPPMGSSLRMLGATSALGVGDAAALGAPYALTDGNPATGWIEGRGGAGAGELVVARVDAPRPVRAIALARSTAAGVSAPRSIFVVGDGGLTLHVTLPDTFERAWVTLPEPRALACLAVVLERGPSDDAALHVGLGEIEVYTELDYGGGIATLIESLVAEGSDAERTADWMRRLGAPALTALDDAWERLSALGRRRAVRVAAAHVELAEARRILVRAAGDDDPEVRADARATSLRASDGGASVLAEIASGTGPGADEAATTLAESSIAYDVTPMLARLADGGADRDALREAIGARFGREHAAVDDALASFRRDAPESALAAAALGLARHAPALSRELIEQAAPNASDFVDRYRLVHAAQHAEPSPALDAWLVSVATQAEEWMLRDAALDALALRSPAAVQAGLADASPRVRATTARLLAADPTSTPRLVDRATRDPWPMVRVAALESLAHRPEELSTLHERLADRAAMVRERVIQLLTERQDRDAWPLLASVFADDDEWPRVTAAGLELASALCVPDAADAIVLVMRRGTREGAWAPHVDVAVEALRIALRLGGDAAEQARTIATRSANEAFAPVLAGQGALPACPAATP